MLVHNPSEIYYTLFICMHALAPLGDFQLFFALDNYIY